MGRTRLAIEVARTLAGTDRIGAWLVDLAPVGSGDAVPHAVAQSLALANVGSMLRPGGLFLTNYAAAPPPPLEPAASHVTAVFFDRQQQNGDTLFSFQRR